MRNLYWSQATNNNKITPKKKPVFLFHYYLCLFHLSRPFNSTENICPDKATNSIVDDPVLGRDEPKVDRLGWNEPAATQEVCPGQLLPQLRGDVVFTLAPAHVGEESKKKRYC